MAIGDAAAAAGLQVVPPSESVRNGSVRLNQRGDEIAAVMARATALEKRQRVWSFPRVSGDNDLWGANTWGTLATATIANAPAGDYLIDTSSVIGSAQPSTHKFRFEILVNGTRVIEFRHDTNDAIRALSYGDQLMGFAGGNLTVTTRMLAPATTNGYVERRGTGIRITYLGRRS